MHFTLVISFLLQFSLTYCRFKCVSQLRSHAVFSYLLSSQMPFTLVISFLLQFSLTCCQVKCISQLWSHSICSFHLLVVKSNAFHSCDLIPFAVFSYLLSSQMYFTVVFSFLLQFSLTCCQVKCISQLWSHSFCSFLLLVVKSNVFHGCDLIPFAVYLLSSQMHFTVVISFLLQFSLTYCQVKCISQLWSHSFLQFSLTCCQVKCISQLCSHSFCSFLLLDSKSNVFHTCVLIRFAVFTYLMSSQMHFTLVISFHLQFSLTCCQVKCISQLWSHSFLQFSLTWCQVKCISQLCSHSFCSFLLLDSKSNVFHSCVLIRFYSFLLLDSKSNVFHSCVLIRFCSFLLLDVKPNAFHTCDLIPFAVFSYLLSSQMHFTVVISFHLQFSLTCCQVKCISQLWSHSICSFLLLVVKSNAFHSCDLIPFVVFSYLLSSQMHFTIVISFHLQFSLTWCQVKCISHVCVCVCVFSFHLQFSLTWCQVKCISQLWSHSFCSFLLLDVKSNVFHKCLTR